MRADALAAALERNAYTLDDGTPCRCERCVHHRDAARLLRELDAVRVAAEAAHAAWDAADRDASEVPAMGDLRTALRGVGLPGSLPGSGDKR